jgi:hypothetical protein
MPDTASLGPGGNKCNVFDIFACLISSACWRREYLAGAHRFVFVLKRGRKGFGWPWAMGWTSVDAGEDKCLGMGALYGARTRIVGARISFRRKFLIACNADAARACADIDDANQRPNNFNPKLN